MVDLAWKSFARGLTRYRVIVVALSLAVVAFVVLVGVIQGMSRAIQDKSARYFAGHIAIQAYFGSAVWYFADPQAIEDAASQVLPDEVRFLRRTVYHHGDATVFFSGGYIAQRRLIGVDWEREHQSLSLLSLSAGAIPDGDDDEAIVISTATAASIGARVGDQVILSFKTRRGQLNTLTLTVRALVDERSFFGYAAYLSRAALNRGMGYLQEAATEIGVLFDDHRRAGAYTEVLHDRLSESFPTVPLTDSRDERNRALSGDGELMVVMPLSANIDELSDLLDALQIVALAVVGAFLLVVVIGVSNTFVLVVRERRRQIATLRALGMRRIRSFVVIATEAGLVGVLCLLVGVPVGFGVLAIVHRFVAVSATGLAGLFLVGGRIPVYLPPEWLGWIALAVLAAALIGTIRPAIRATGVSPVEGLRDE